MQGMSGIELSEKLARINTAVKLFLMTAYEIDSDMQEATGNIRVDEVFKKPVPPKVMLSTIAKHASDELRTR
jgi:CheY-like chemotaxis protein